MSRVPGRAVVGAHGRQARSHLVAAGRLTHGAQMRDQLIHYERLAAIGELVPASPTS